MKPIKGYIPQKKQEEPKQDKGLVESMLGVSALFNELKDLKKDVVEQVDDKIKDIDNAVSSYDGKIKEIDDAIENLGEVVVDIVEQVKTVQKGDKGEDAKEVDEDAMEERLLAKIPKLEQIVESIPKVDEDKLVKKVIKAIPESKASLKVIRETFKLDPMDVVTTILGLPTDKFQLKIENIGGLREEIASYRNQLANGKGGYVHGGGFNNIYSAGTLVSNGLTGLNFTGSGVASVTKSATTGIITVDITGGGASGLEVGTTTITGGTTTRILYDNAGVLGEYTLSGSGTVVAMATAPTFGTSITGSYLTASEILITDGSKNIVSAPVATYPSLTELTYLKGVTSAIQTQLNTKLSGSGTAGYVPFYSSATVLTSEAHFNYNSTTHILHVHGLAGDATDGLLLESDNGTDIAILGVANTANGTWYGNHNFEGGLIQIGKNATTLGKLTLFGNTSGSVTIQPNAVAGTGIVLTAPATTGTIALTSDITSPTLANVSSLSTDATKSTYTMSAGIPVHFKSSDANTLLYLDETNERLAIGHSSPTAPLDIKGVNTIGTISSEMITLAADRDFSSDTGNWTGTNWTIGGGVATHTAGANNFTLANSALSAAPVAGQTYLISYTMTTTVAGGSNSYLNVRIGGDTSSVNLGTVTGTVTNRVALTASNTGALTFVVTNSTWQGTIDNISVKLVTASSPTEILRNSDGSSGVEMRSGGPYQDNIFYGNYSGQFATTNAYYNMGVGAYTLRYLDSGQDNVAIGAFALINNIDGDSNVGIGSSALSSNALGNFNTAIGGSALGNLITGDNNIAIGRRAGYSSNKVNFSNNIFIGANVSTSNITDGASGNISIGYNINLPTAAGSNQMTIGNLLYATGLGATGTTVSTANFGISTAAPVCKLHIGVAPTASANYGLVSLGSGAFDGSTAGFFTGSASGTTLAINNATGFAGNLADLQVAGVSKFNITSGGLVTSADSFVAATGAYFYWSARSVMASPSNGIINLTTQNLGSFTRLNFGPATSSFPALKVSTTSLEVRLADDSAYTNLNGGTADFNGYSVGVQRLRFNNASIAGNIGYIKGVSNGLMQTLNAAENANGSLLYSVVVTPKTQAASPYTVSATENSTRFTNEGATSAVTFNLPTAVAGYTYTFIVQDADDIIITANTGDTIRIAGTVTAAAGSITGGDIGSSVTLTAINATEWIAESSTGTWTF